MSGMRIGFTGTQQGMTAAQQQTFASLLAAHSGEFHHGDCIGADAEAHDIAQLLLYEITIHPPNIPYKRAFKVGKFEWAPRPYLERNHQIVDASEWLLATPKESEEQMRSGTWATIRYAIKRKCDVSIILPNGTVRCV